MIEELGFKVKIGKHALKTTNHTAGNPKERAEDINNFFRDREVKAIFTFIGGNHSNQTLAYLDFNHIRRNPKIFVGYSDNTILHFALYTKSNLVSFYGPAVLTQFAENPSILEYTREYFKKATMNQGPIGKIKSSEKWTDETLDWSIRADLKRPRRLKKNPGWSWIRWGKARGPILGGCITSMMHLRGTSFWPDFTGKILFWEIPEGPDDFAKGENVETIDAYLTDLDLSGVFKKIKGMIIGRPFGYTPSQNKDLIKIIKERTKNYSFPILHNVDIGHTDPMITIPLGIETRLDSKKNLFEFLEGGVV